MKPIAFLLPVLLVMGLAMILVAPNVEGIPESATWNYVGMSAGSGVNSTHTFTAGYVDEFNVDAGTPISLILASYRANLNESSGGYYHGLINVYEGSNLKSSWEETTTHHVASLGGGTSFALAGPSSLDFTTQDNKVYFIQYIILVTEADDVASNVTDSLEYSLTVQEPPVISANNTINWVYAIIWIVIAFIVPWILNFAIPRLGLIMGMAIMTIILMVSNPTYIVVAVISFGAVGIMLFTYREEPEVVF